MNFGTQMRILRRVRKMSQRDLGDLVGISRSYITGIELGIVNCTPEIEIRIRAAVNWPAQADEAFDILAETDQVDA